LVERSQVGGQISSASRSGKFLYAQFIVSVVHFTVSLKGAVIFLQLQFLSLLPVNTH
jgi:hypothetical protein